MFYPPTLCEQTYKDIYDMLELPVGCENSYIKINNGGRLIFLEDYGLVIRIDLNRGDFKPAPEHDLVLQPLKRFKYGSAVVSILPAIKVLEFDKNWLKTAKSLRKTLGKDGIKYWDIQHENTGLIYSTKLNKYVPVVLDQDAARYADPAPQFIEQVKKALNTQNKKNGQTENFNGLQSLFTPLAQKLDKGLKNKDLKDFYQAARKMLSTGKLENGWVALANDNTSHKTIAAHKASKTYSDQVRKDHTQRYGISF